MNELFNKLKRFYSSDRKLTILMWMIMGFALLVRLIFVVFQFEHDVMANFSDDKLYMLIAEQIMKQGPWVLDTSSIQMDVVGYGLPHIMAFLMILFGKSWLTLFI